MYVYIMFKVRGSPSAPSAPSAPPAPSAASPEPEEEEEVPIAEVVSEDEEGTLGQFLEYAIAKDPDALCRYVQSEKFQKLKMKECTHQEIMLAIRAAIEQRHEKMLHQLDHLFNLDNPNDTRTMWLAAKSPMNIFNIFASKKAAMNQRFEPHEHPLVSAAISGNIEVARWLKKWADENGVSSEVKSLAYNCIAQKGHRDLLDLYKVSDAELLKVVKTLIANDHAHLVKQVVKRINEDGHPLNDLSYKNFAILRCCSGHVGTLGHVIRHPTIQSGMNMLPPYFHAVNAYTKKKFDIAKSRHIESHKNFLATKANNLVSHGIEPDSAVLAVKHQYQADLDAALTKEDLHSYTHNAQSSCNSCGQKP